jgi:hypothetical protein
MSDQQQNQQGGWATGWRRSAEARNRTTRLLFGEFSFLPPASGLLFCLPPRIFLGLARDHGGGKRRSAIKAFQRSRLTRNQNGQTIV